MLTAIALCCFLSSILRCVPSAPRANSLTTHSQLWAAYKQAHESIWSPTDIELSKDRIQWESALSQTERDFMSVILAFFAASDGIVVENLAQRFCAEVQIPEARCFYGVQIMMYVLPSALRIGH